ncbi:Uncharacterised protein [Mycobacteroides abscessus subsp. abscessus]|nr:Uncharacterised protein [Mycobacteroides abscessus subsp. abscessus]
MERLIIRLFYLLLIVPCRPFFYYLQIYFIQMIISVIPELSNPSHFLEIL